MHVNKVKFEELRKERNWTQNEMARQLKIPVSTFSDMMNGKRGVGTKTMTKVLNLFPNENLKSIFEL